MTDETKAVDGIDVWLRYEGHLRGHLFATDICTVVRLARNAIRNRSIESRMGEVLRANGIDGVDWIGGLNELLVYKQAIDVMAAKCETPTTGAELADRTVREANNE